MTAQSRERIVPRLIEEEMRESFLDYSMSVIVQRALPDVRDGLKPVHRRILFAMHELGLNPDRPHKKSAAVVGDVLGKYHPHGDSAVYDAMVRMVQDFSLRYPLIDGQGNFGSIDGDSAAAYRYTEARLAPVAEELLADIDRETVDFAPNFDDRLQEPTVLPARLPNLLVNGSSGIAVGMSTNVPPHNLREVAAALHELVEEPEPTVESLMKHISGPDFPTGGFVVGTEGIRSMYETGRGRMRVRARIVQEALRGGKKQLVVTELPYAVSKTRIIEQIADLSRRGKLDEITDLRDESDRDGLRLVVELKRGVKTAKVLTRLFKKTSLETTFGGIVLALDQGEPREFDLLTLLERYRDHRLEIIQRRSRYELEKAQSERHVTEGLLAALDAVEEVVAIIRSSADRAGASQSLQDRLGLSEVQADAILNMRLARLTSLEHGQLKDRLKALEASIRNLKAILKSEAAQLEVMLEELDEIVEKYGDARRTVILDGEDQAEIEVKAQIAAEDVVITVSHNGFVKRVPMHLYQRRVSRGRALAGMDKYEDDYLESVFVGKTQGWILTFTEGGHVFFLPVLDVPEGSRASRGRSVYSLTEADRKDPVIAMLPVDDLSADRLLVFLSERGVMKRSKLADFGHPRAGGIIASGLKEGDRILDVAFSDGGSEVMLITREGRAIRFVETDLTVMGRTARGVKAIDLQIDDVVVGMLLIRREAWVLTVTDGGMGRRTEVGEFPLQKRGGRGTLTTPQKAGSSLVAALEVLEADEVMIVAAGGQVSRVSVAEIPSQGRRTQGIRVVELEEGDRVVEVTRAHREPSGSSRVVDVVDVMQDQDNGPAEGAGQLDLLG
ncbi:MAG: DNA gyrase subunit A [Longimicrobiales bacterium]